MSSWAVVGAGVADLRDHSPLDPLMYCDIVMIRCEAGISSLNGAERQRKRIAMLAHGLLAKAAGTVVTGLVGVSAYEVVRTVVGTAPVRRASVAVAELGLRGTRWAEVAAESARLKVADVVAEARERIGEEASPPAAAGEVHDHDHCSPA